MIDERADEASPFEVHPYIVISDSSASIVVVGDWFMVLRLRIQALVCFAICGCRRLPESQ